MSLLPSTVNTRPVNSIILVTVFALCATLSAPSLASTQMVGRYSSAKTTPLAAQQDLMMQTLQVHFPASVETGGQAIEYLLQRSGYALVEKSKQAPEFIVICQKPLPLVDRDLRYLTLKDALTTLVAPAFSLQTEPLTREVSFKVKASYLKKIKTT